MDAELSGRALGLAGPWQVVEVEVDENERRLDIGVDFQPGSEFDCSACGLGGCKAHDTAQRTRRHTNCFERRTFLHARHPRARCA